MSLEQLDEKSETGMLLFFEKARRINETIIKLIKERRESEAAKDEDLMKLYLQHVKRPRN